ncbi:DUF4013 domain-containing protein [Halosolutus gelatinilyticus]|uniref:DUF4013 domain-containing protein n=1 Tax=Halosolutus gelatinilyticus TaxID=2931975 RepID=UPI001FF15E8B|nr:DUF4013 domain-containing protein [Halosolutus gelatinilyticus]
MLAESVTYLKNSDHVWRTSIIGGVLLLLGFLFIPLFLVWGYVVRVLDRTARGDDDAPEFDDWGDLLVDGVKAFAITLVYVLVPSILGGVVFGGIWTATDGNPGTIASIVLAIGGLLTVAAFVAAAYVMPAALTNFATDRRIGAGFDFETLRPTLSSGTYAVGWLTAVGIILVGTIVSGLLNAIPYVGTVAGGIISFYALVAAYYVIGHAWFDLHPVSVDERRDGPSDEQPAV